jgi:tRNA(Arg) A34 adenosine deaminase TadA
MDQTFRHGYGSCSHHDALLCEKRPNEIVSGRYGRLNPSFVKVTEQDSVFRDPRDLNTGNRDNAPHSHPPVALYLFVRTVVIVTPYILMLCVTLPWFHSGLDSSTPLVISLPDWLIAYEKTLKETIYRTNEEMMAVAVEISRLNVEHKSGGPFGCAIFERDLSTNTCRIFSVGANRVMPLHNSSLHGEMTALQFAERKLQHFSLKTEKDSPKEYVMCTSCEPCAQCLGGTLWAGPAEMICGASKDDAEAIGFNEGPVFPESYVSLEENGIKVTKGVLQKEAAAILNQYAETGTIYNS